MAMGKRPREEQMGWISAADLPKSPGNPFYVELNRMFAKHEFDAFAEKACAKFYARTMGRPSLAPGIYFRCLLVGYFEELGSERGIGWRCSDSLSLRTFLGVPLENQTPDHSTISRTRRLIDVETHAAVFTWVLKRLAEEDLVKGKTLGVDSTTAEANAAMRTIVRRADGQTYQEFLVKLATESGIQTPTREDLARLDRSRKNKASNKDWKHPYDPDARVTKMKDGSTHLAHKVEHAVDMQTGAVVGVTVQEADQADTQTLPYTLLEATKQLAEVRDDPATGFVPAAEPMVQEVVADKGYHSNQVLVDLEEVGIRPYLSEPKRGRRNWKDKGRERRAVYANRRRVKGQRGKRLMRQRGERLERPFAHTLETGGLRRLYVCGHKNVRKRMLLQFAATNLGLLMRTLCGVGTPRSLQGAGAALAQLLRRAADWLVRLLHAIRSAREAQMDLLTPLLVVLAIHASNPRKST